MKTAQLKSAPKIAKLFMTGGSQAVRLPKEYRFDSDEVEISREGDRVIFTPIKMRLSWPEYFETVPRINDDDFLDDRKDLPVQDRNIFDE